MVLVRSPTVDKTTAAAGGGRVVPTERVPFGPHAGELGWLKPDAEVKESISDAKQPTVDRKPRSAEPEQPIADAM